MILVISRPRVSSITKVIQSWPVSFIHRPSPIYVLCIVVISAFFSFHAVQASPSILIGTVTHVRDGDTIEVNNIPIRLNGVSAPELDEPLGNRSKAYMTELVIGKTVRCELNGQKTYDRWVGVCYL